MDFATPSTFKVNAINVDVNVLFSKRTGKTFFDVLIRFLAEVADGFRGNFASPESLIDVLNTTNRNTGQVHLNQGFFYGTVTALIALDDGSFKLNALKFGSFESRIP